MRTRLLLALLLLGGCAAEQAPAEQAPAEPTTGGETPSEAPDDGLTTTMLIPVPQPGRPRAELSTELQTVWARVEEAIAVAPPEPPEATDAEGSVDIEAWAEGPFADWLERRGAANAAAIEAMQRMGQAPVEERAMGTALLGYLYEDAVSAVRGAPVPDAIAEDPELLSIYVESLHEALMPFARMSAQGYYGCLVLFREVSDPAWSEWPGYCDSRGAEVVEVFGLVPAEPAAEGDAGVAP